MLQKNHIMLVAALSLMAGIALAPHTQIGAWPWLLFPAGMLACFLLRMIGLRPHFAVAVLAFSIGLLSAQSALQSPKPLEGRYTVTGRVYGAPMLRSEERMTFLLSDVLLDGNPAPTKAYCTLYTYGNEVLPSLFDGAELRFTGRVYHPPGKSGPHDFDFRLWLLQNGISFGITSVADLYIQNTPETARPNDFSSRIRGQIRDALSRTMGEESRIAMAMLLSDRENIPQDELLAFQTTGISHIMSVSGLHVGIVGGMLAWLLGKMKIHRHAQLLITALTLVGYCALTGFSAAAVRAATMLILALSARSLLRSADPLILLSTACVVILLFRPLDLFSAGFVLSFSAMAGILLLTPRFRQLFHRAGWYNTPPPPDPFALFPPTAFEKAKRLLHMQSAPFASMLSVSLGAQLGVMLPTAFYFHQLPLYGVFINLLIIPLTSLLIPLYFITLALSPLPWPGAAVGYAAKMLTAALLRLVKLLSTLPYASIRVPSASVWLLCAAALLAVLLSRYCHMPWKQKTCTAVLILAVAFGGSYLTRPPALRYIQLSAGQEDAALMMDGNITIAIDVGTSGTQVAGYLLAEGRNLDALFITHLHLDHVGGIVGLLDAGIHIGHVYLPIGAQDQRIDPETLPLLTLLQERGIPITELAAGDKMRYNEISMQVQWPVRETIRRLQDPNDLPLVLLIDFGGYRILSASDLTARYEAYAAAPCDILKVAHHGSAGSTGDTFLTFASPQFAIITCNGTSQRLPAPSTLNRLLMHGIPFYRTDETGDITLTLPGGKLALSTYK